MGKGGRERKRKGGEGEEREMGEGGRREKRERIDSEVGEEREEEEGGREREKRMREKQHLYQLVVNFDHCAWGYQFSFSRTLAHIHLSKMTPSGNHYMPAITALLKRTSAQNCHNIHAFIDLLWLNLLPSFPAHTH